MLAHPLGKVAAGRGHGMPTIRLSLMVPGFLC
jgi:hypothetical protein